MAWGPGHGWDGDDEEMVAREGAGQTLVHETHAPKRISHIQFGLLNSEVCYIYNIREQWTLYSVRGAGCVVSDMAPCSCIDPEAFSTSTGGDVQAQR